MVVSEIIERCCVWFYERLDDTHDFDVIGQHSLADVVLVRQAATLACTASL